MPLRALVERGPAQGHTLVDRAVVADLRRLADHDAHAVVDEDAPADRRAGVDLDAGEKPRQMRDESPEPTQTVYPAPMRTPVQDERMQPGVAGQHFPGRARCRITRPYAIDVFS
jgi:hypothetical protein